tara:strand:- start:47604 stop:48212 length:609 start_codon:yes stop_codon:yes gene_type:complete
MSSEYNISDLIQFHNAIDDFNYNLTVDWAIDLIRNGLETDNVFMLASFTKPVDKAEVKPYLSAVLKDLSLEEKEGKEATFEFTHYHMHKILGDDAIRRNLDVLYELFLENDSFNDDDKFGLTPFYFLHYAWSELEDIGCNFYFEGATLDNIEEVIKEQASIWIDKYIHGIKIDTDKVYHSNYMLSKSEKKETLFSKIKIWFS